MHLWWLILFVLSGKGSYFEYGIGMAVCNLNANRNFFFIRILTPLAMPYFLVCHSIC